jgi:DNA-binding transcriptional LysR family regulator
MTHSFNLESLRCFLAFSETLNFTRTAELMYISQPAVHVKIRDLSEKLGVDLYRKVGRRLELTEAGKKLARLAREIESRVEAFESELTTGSSSQPVVLAAGAGTYLHLIGDAIREYSLKSRHALKLLTVDRDAAIEAVQSGRAQLGVASLETIPEQLESRVLFRIGQVLVMPRNHPLSAKKVLSLRDLQGSKLIVPPADRPHRMLLARLLQNARVEWDIAVEASGWELMLKFASLGLGLAIVNDFGNLPRGLIARPIKELPVVYYQLFHLKGRLNKPGALHLKELLISSAAQWKKDRE